MKKNKTKKINTYLIAFIAIIILVITSFIALNTEILSNYFNKEATQIDSSVVDLQTDYKTPTANEETEDNLTDSLLVANITYIQKSNEVLRVGTIINELTSEGSCIITLTKDDIVISEQVDIQALSSTSTCKGFSIPFNQLSSGIWDISLTIEANSKSIKLNSEYEIE